MLLRVLANCVTVTDLSGLTRLSLPPNFDPNFDPFSTPINHNRLGLGGALERHRAPLGLQYNYQMGQWELAGERRSIRNHKPIFHRGILDSVEAVGL